MIYNTEGLILKEQPIGEKDKLVTILTRDHGVIRCFARGARNPKHGLFAPMQALSYSRITVYHGKNSDRIEEAESIRLYRSVTGDLTLLSLAQYFCEIVIRIIPENTPSSEQLDLLLNCLYLLSEQKKTPSLIKAVYEIRTMVLSGHMPNLLYCSACGCYEADRMYFNYTANELICASCTNGNGTLSELSRGALTALRYITLAEPKKLFSFRLSEESLYQLSVCSEKYTLAVAETSFNALTMYHQLQGWEGPATQSS